ncbi:CGNR zinc finger domain-containing protein [Lacibacterium aquatile]|uniref:CGNR zinc finger domain-containing protein n=1 Tax=Lacibacterium aquatile TaxID=1168082 RepID=A0ABW5E0I1_9PROT
MDQVKRQHGPYRSPQWIDSFCGGAVCLDFVNTVEQLDTAKAEERLTSYDALLAWSRARETAAADPLDRLARVAARNPKVAEAVWRDAIALRGEMRAFLHRIEAGETPDPKPMNERLRTLPALPPLIVGGDAYLPDLPGRDPGEVVWPVLWSLSALLTSSDAGRLGICGGQGCGYLFLDHSRNRSRRWCSSEGCGNRERARRAYHAHKAD